MTIYVCIVYHSTNVDIYFFWRREREREKEEESKGWIQGPLISQQNSEKGSVCVCDESFFLLEYFTVDFKGIINLYGPEKKEEGRPLKS